MGGRGTTDFIFNVTASYGKTGKSPDTSIASDSVIQNLFSEEKPDIRKIIK